MRSVAADLYPLFVAFSRRVHHWGVCALLIACLGSGCRPSSAEATGEVTQAETVDREYHLKATMLGYFGIGGEIDGDKNPTLTAEQGDRVRITIENGELMVHDVAMEKHGAASAQILEEGAESSLIFTAQTDDTYYCTVPGHRLAGMVGEFRLVEAGPAIGVLPTKEGRPLNLDFETGTLEDWVAAGSAFERQPLQGSVIEERRSRRMGHAGEYFIATPEVYGDTATGTLTSETFAITHPYASFRVGGGASRGVRVELVLVRNDEVFYTIAGLETEQLRPVVVDLRSHREDEMYVRLVDEEIGGWGHLNFDDFKFYERRPIFSNERDPHEPVYSELPPMDDVRHAGLPPEEARKAMTLPEGFSIDLAAAEPDVVRPIAMALDHRGRVWIAEGHTYPVRAAEGEGNDRILIFEDTNGDGRLDSRKIFMERLNLVSGLEVGFGGVWVGAAPYLIFIPIADDGDSPAGEPKILLDGWGYQDTHETLNGFNWGPDGWLYGCHGIFTHSNVGKPGSPEEERQPINGGIWRYHPREHRFEVVVHGTSNPWGIDFDDHGEAFATVCVIPHLFHVIPGARYQRQVPQHFNPYTYDDIKAIGDHVHWAGNQGPYRGSRRSGAAGGGHAHAGAMIYLGGSWPEEYRSRIFMNNIHGFRINTDILERRGSGYVGRHGPDFVLANDSWFQGLNFRYGPGGSVYWIDWYDKNQCHSSNPDLHDRSLGRIYRIRHENDSWEPVDLSTKSSMELVELQLHENDWYVRHARRLLQERGSDPEVYTALWKILKEHPNVTRKLRVFWALQVTGGIDEEQLIHLSEHPEEHVRAWAVRFLVEAANPSADMLNRFATMAAAEESSLVRLYLASALQRMRLNDRWEILGELVRRNEDATDANIPLMLWYAMEPLAAENPERALAMAAQAEVANILPFTLRRISALGYSTAHPLFTQTLAAVSKESARAEIQKAVAQLEAQEAGQKH